jgi:hypothetical protein
MQAEVALGPRGGPITWREEEVRRVRRTRKARRAGRDPSCDQVRPAAAGDAVRRIASRYLGAEAGAAYAGSAGDDLLIRLEPGDLRAWDFADELS